MVTLWYGIVGAARRVFCIDTSVGMGTDNSVAALKCAIKNQNPALITCDACALQLFVDKEGKYKLTEAIVLQGLDASVTSGMTHLKFGSASVNSTCLSRLDERAQLTETDLAEGKFPLDVVVVIPQDATANSRDRRQSARVTVASWFDDLAALAAMGQKLNRETDLAMGEVVNTPKQVFGTVLSNGLYVRKEYWDLYGTIEQELKAKGDELVMRVLVTGSPGIGKSVFGVFLLLLFMTEKKDVAYLPLGGMTPYYFTWHKTEDCYEISTSPLGARKYEGLFDGKESGEALAFGPFRHVLLFAGPCDKNFHHFVKDVCIKIYMNPWSKDECQTLADAVHWEDQGEWLRRFNLVGGKPRLLFSPFLKYDHLEKRVESALPDTVDEMVVTQICEFQRQDFGEEMRHILFLIYRDVNEASYSSPTFSSLKVEKMLYARYRFKSADQTRSLLQSLEKRIMQAEYFHS